jgi:hypothetical protein
VENKIFFFVSPSNLIEMSVPIYMSIFPLYEFSVGMWYFFVLFILLFVTVDGLQSRGGSSGGGGGPGARPPRIGKNMIFWRKIVIFHTKYPKNVRASLRNWKKYDFLALNRDFSHEIPQQFSRLPPLGVIFLSSLPPSLKSWIRP